jgi:hypothetical protein
MRIRELSTALLLAFVAAAGAVSTGCSKKSSEPVSADSTDTEPHGLTEGHDSGTIVWEVKSDGKVRALVKTADGKPVEKDLRGRLLWKGPSGEAKVALHSDEKSGLLVGSGPRLEGDLTEIRYTITVAGSGWAGALHLPAGGTDELEESARRAAQAPPPDKTGPNGGIVQVVGGNVVEIVAEKSSGQVRVYLLDESNRPLPMGSRKAKLGIVGGSVEMVALSPGPGGLYLTGRLVTKVDPVKLTIALTNDGRTSVVLCGYEPEVVVAVGAAAPALPLLVNVNWNVDVHGPRTPVVVGDDDDDDGRGRGHRGGRGRGHGHGHK